MRTRKPSGLYRVPEDEVKALIEALVFTDDELWVRLKSLSAYAYWRTNRTDKLRELAAAAIILARRLDA